ncbi:MAG: cyclopropane-fatty-acyl-phospholipid synthase family protein [Longimicrobiales bacterium]|nr:cyclopropane-fatty-acyl-phospholipid synthase family protein [Longimicrobiales bacterium]
MGTETTMYAHDSPVLTRPDQSVRALDRVCRRVVLARLGALVTGRITLRDDDGAWCVASPAGERAPRHAEIRVHDPGFWYTLATRGSIGFGEAYVDGVWDTPDLVEVIAILAANRSLLDRMDRGGARLHAGLLKGAHRIARNTLGGSRRNIAAHYDLGNDFFARWLDREMHYSSALFASGNETLEEAQEAKARRIAERLQLGPADHLLEIGTGWGGLAIQMARETGCRVTTTTISTEQDAYARARVRDAGLEDRIEVLCRDYRELDGLYDKVVSVEMVEAVGADWLDTYMGVIDARLAPDGLALIQAITIEDYRYRSALAEVDFIKRHIFPGSFIPSVSAITGAMARVTQLGLLELFDLGDSYALTLAHWRRRFEAAWSEIRAMGFDEAFRRRWRYYLAYCEGGFRERALSDVHLLLAGPDYRKESGSAFRAR